jgi:hypothetical protein
MSAGVSMGSMFDFSKEKKAPLLSNEDRITSNPLADGNL